MMSALYSPHPADPLYLLVTRSGGKFCYATTDYLPNERGPDRPQGLFITSYRVASEDRGKTLEELGAIYHAPPITAPLPRIVSQIQEPPEPIVEPTPPPPAEPNRVDISDLPEPAGERFVSPCPLPSDREREILVILIEEAAEVQQRATKMLRFGVDEIQPGQPWDNANRLSFEVGDFLEMLAMAERARLIRPDSIRIGQERKRQQLAKFMQTQPDAQEIA